MDESHFNFPYTKKKRKSKSRKTDEGGGSSSNNSVTSLSEAEEPPLFKHLLTRVHKPNEIANIWDSIDNRRRKKILSHCFMCISKAGDTNEHASKLTRMTKKRDARGQPIQPKDSSATLYSH